MDDTDLALTVLLLLIPPLLGLFYASHSLADELSQFIRDRGEWHNLVRWRADRQSARWRKAGQCPNDGYPMLGYPKCPRCGWKRDD